MGRPRVATDLGVNAKGLGGSRREPVRIAITGGAGFIGRHLAAALVADGRAVRAVSHASPDAPLPWGLGGVAAEFVAADVTDRDATERALEGVDAVVHLAGMSLPRRCRQFPLEAFRANALGTATVIDACRSLGVHRVVTASSRHVAEVAFAPAGDAYALSKWVAEAWTLDAGQVVARLDNVYGPGQAEGAVVPDFMRRTLDGAPAHAGPSDEVVPLLYVSDAVRALALLATSERVCGLYAVTAPTLVPLDTLGAVVIASSAGRTAPSIDVEAPRGGDPRLAGLGWSPVVAWPEGVARTWKAWVERHAVTSR